MGAFALPMLGKITVETQHLVPFGVATLLEPSVQDGPSSYLFPMFRTLPVHMVYSEKDRPRLAATGAAWVTVWTVAPEDFQLEA